jgi:hypothetical protein
MQRFKHVVLPCQFCATPLQRVSWRESSPATCFDCKTRRRSELAKLKSRKVVKAS